MKPIPPEIYLYNALEIILIATLIVGGMFLFTFASRQLLRRRKYGLEFSLLFPGALGLLLMSAIPILYEFYLALTNMTSLVTNGKDYFLDPDVGLGIFWGHLSELFGGPWFILALSNNLVYAILQVFGHTVLALLFAQLLNRPLKGKGVYRALLTLPWVIPSLATLMAWRNELHWEYGIFNIILRGLKLSPIHWWDGGFWGGVVANILVLWYSYPFLFMVVTGALESVPQEYHEAAEVDGAGGIWRFFQITLPMIQPVLGPALVLDFIWTFNNANPSLTIPGASMTMTSYVFLEFTQTPIRFGLAAAFALVVFVFLFIFSMLAHRWFASPNPQENK